MPRWSRFDPATVTMVVACLGFFMVVVDTTAVNVALADIDADLGAGVSGLQWVVDSYTVVFAALLLSAGALADRIGATRAYLWGLAVFVLASAACALAPSLELLVAARVVQGMAGAVMMPSSLALVTRAYADPAGQRRAISVWTAFGGMAIIAGVILGGVLTQAISWRAVFFVNVPIGVAGLAVRHLLVTSPPRLGRPLDALGQVAAIVALATLTLGVIEGGHQGFDEPYVVAALVLCVVAAALFVVIELRVPEPAVPFRLFATPAASGTLLVAFLMFVAFYGQVFVLSLFFQGPLDREPAAAGLLFLPMALLCAIGTLSSPRFVGRFGPWVPMAIGVVVMIVGLLALMTVDEDTSVAGMAPALALLGFGMGLGGPPMPMALMAILPEEHTGIGSAVFNAMRQTGATLGVAIFGAMTGAATSFVDGMRESLLAGVLGLGVCLLIVLAAIRPRVTAPAPAPTPTA